MRDKEEKHFCIEMEARINKLVEIPLGDRDKENRHGSTITTTRNSGVISLQKASFFFVPSSSTMRQMWAKNAPNF